MDMNKELLQYVLVIGLRNESGTPKPFVSYRFPPQHDKDTLADAIQQFCFPEAEQWLDPELAKKQLKSGNKSQTFNFVLTESDGGRKFGYCRRMIVDGGKEYIPECYCILTLLPSVSLFSRILDIVEELRKKSSSAVFAFLKSVLAKSFPLPGQTITVKTFEGNSWDLTRSDNDFMLDFVSFGALFKHTDVEKIMTLFCGLLTESRIIICAKDVSTLSSCVNAVSALIYPFTWQHVFIPILPKGLMSYCCAPMPFMVGVLTSNLSELNKYPMEEVIMLDVDTGKFLRDLPPTVDYKKVLPASAEQLKKSLSTTLKRGLNARAFDLDVAQQFLDYMFTVFVSYPSYMKNHKFDREAFKQDRSAEVQKFLGFLYETQMWEMFVREREKMSAEGQLDMCALSEKRFTAVSSKTSEAVGIELTKGSHPCCKCGLDVKQGEVVEKRGKTYCQSCYLERKQRKKAKFKGLMPNLSVSMPAMAKEHKVPIEERSKSSNVLKPTSKSAPPTMREDDPPKAKGASFLDRVSLRTKNTGNKSPKAQEEEFVAKELSRASTSPTVPRKPTIRFNTENSEGARPHSFTNMKHFAQKEARSNSESPPRQEGHIMVEASLQKQISESVLNQRRMTERSLSPPPLAGRPERSMSPPPLGGGGKAFLVPRQTTASRTPPSKPLPQLPPHLDLALIKEKAYTTQASAREHAYTTQASTRENTTQASARQPKFCRECGSPMRDGACPSCDAQPKPASTSGESSGATVCAKCQRPIGEDPMREILGHTYHSSCFTCAVCNQPFTDAITFKSDKAYHAECFKQANA